MINYGRKLFTSLSVLALLFTANYAQALTNWEIEWGLQADGTFELTNAAEYLYQKPDYLSAPNITSFSIADYYASFKSQLPQLVVGSGQDGLGKVVGDEFVQRKFILDQIRRIIGRSIINFDDYSSEDAQIEALYLAGLQYATDNSVVWVETPFGRDRDIIWVEERFIHGERVLVPIVYLTEETIAANIIDEHEVVFSGTNADFDQVQIGEGAVLKLRGQFVNLSKDLFNSGLVDVGESVELIDIAGTLYNHSAEITAQSDLTVHAAALEHRTLLVPFKNEYGEGQVAGRVAEINSVAGSINMTIDGDIDIAAADITASNGSLTLESTNGDIRVLGAEVNSAYARSNNLGSINRTSVDILMSHLSSKDTLKLIGDTVTIGAAELFSSDGAIEILAQEGVYITNQYGQFQEQRHNEASVSTTEDISLFKTMAIKANLRAGKGILINSEAGDIVLRAAEIESQDGTVINAKDGQVKMLLAKERDVYNYNSISEGMLTIETETESWDRDTAVYNTIVGGVEISATQGIVVEYAGKEGATPQEQIDAMAELTGIAGMEWFGDLQSRDCAASNGDWSTLTEEEKLEIMTTDACVDFGFVELMDKYEYDHTTNLSPAAMAIIAIVATVATGGVGATIAGSLSSSLGVGAYGAMANAALTSLVTQATQISVNTALNGGSPYDAWKEMGSDENLTQLATSIVTAGALSKLNSVWNSGQLIEGQVGFLPDHNLAADMFDQSLQMMAETTVKASINVLAEGNSLSDFGHDFHNAFEDSLRHSVVQEIGQGMASAIGNATDLNDAIALMAHAATGCVVQSAFSDSSEDEKLKCYSGGIGAVVGELTASLYEHSTEAEATEELLQKVARGEIKPGSQEEADFINDYINTGADISKLTAAFGAFVAGGDVNAAADAAFNAAKYNQLSENDEKFRAEVIRLTELANQMASGQVIFTYLKDGNLAASDGAALLHAGLSNETLMGLLGRRMELDEAQAVVRDLERADAAATKAQRTLFCESNPSSQKCQPSGLLVLHDDPDRNAQMLSDLNDENVANHSQLILNEFKNLVGFGDAVGSEIRPVWDFVPGINVGVFGYDIIIAAESNDDQKLGEYADDAAAAGVISVVFAKFDRIKEGGKRVFGWKRGRVNSPGLNVGQDMPLFGDDDLVYGTYVGGKVRELVNSNGGKALSDFDKPPGLDWKQFSANVMDDYVGNGSHLHFDLTNVSDIDGALNASGPFASSTTSFEIRYLRDNWQRFSDHVTFYINKIVVKPPWE